MHIVLLPSVSVFSHQQTPLHIASRKGYVETVERLVRLKADISIKDYNGVCVTILLRLASYIWSNASCTEGDFA